MCEYKLSLGKPESKKSPGRRMHRWKNYSKIYFGIGFVLFFEKGNKLKTAINSEEFIN
jgi:hypothetical protein